MQFNKSCFGYCCAYIEEARKQNDTLSFDIKLQKKPQK